MSETGTGLAEAPRPVDTEVRKPLVAPTETPAEKAPTPERDGWAKSGMHALLLLGRKEIGEGLDKKDLKQLDALADGAIPETKHADAAAANVCGKYWEGKTSNEANDEWSESLDKFLAKQEGNEFFERMGFTLKAGGAETIKNRFLMDETGVHFRENSIGEFAWTIADANSPEQIQENMDSIKELAKLYGDTPEAIQSVVEHIQALSNLKANREKFKESAQAEMAMGDEDMAGAQTMEWIRANAEQYGEKVEKRTHERDQNGKLYKAIKDAQRVAPEDKTRSEALAKHAKGIPLDPDNDEPQALFDGKISIPDLKLEDENGNSIDQITAFKKVLDRLAKEDKVDPTVSEKIEDWILHESRHFDEALKYYKKESVNFIIYLSKDREGNFIVHPHTEYTELKDDNISEEQKAQIVGRIMAAPGLGKTSEDVAGMSRHDMESIGLYTYKTKDDGSLLLDDNGDPVGEPIEAVTEARKFMNDPTKQDSIAEFIDSRAEEGLTREQREQVERDICAQIAFKLKKEPTWEINLEKLSED